MYKRKVMMVMSGISGAGKTTYANRLMERLNRMFGWRVAKCSADDYFINDGGDYIFDRTKLGSAHGYCKYEAAKLCRAGNDLVIIDNTNLTNKEISPYRQIAKEYGYDVVVRCIGSSDEESIENYIKRNAHGVPEEAIRRMAKRWFAKQ